MAKERRYKNRIKDMAVVSMNVAIISVSSWISIPFAVNFTLQTLVIFTICSLFDFRRSMTSIILYIILGICGIPVFSGFTAGPSAIFGPTGGYLIGFLFVPIIMQIFSVRNKKRIFIRILIMLAALCAVYILGTLWYYFVYLSGEASLFEVIAVCVIPFIIPDTIKITVAAIISSRLSSMNI